MEAYYRDKKASNNASKRTWQTGLLSENVTLRQWTSGSRHPKNGTALSQEDRVAFAKQNGQCEFCGLATHKLKSFGRKRALNNDHVYHGICIHCHSELVPETVVKEWRARNPATKPKSEPRWKPSKTQPTSSGPAEDSKEKSYNTKALIKKKIPSTRAKVANVSTGKSSLTSLCQEPTLTVFQASPLAYED